VATGFEPDAVFPCVYLVFSCRASPDKHQNRTAAHFIRSEPFTVPRGVLVTF
jgi:hypothetical protein